ncbi:MAG TPA: allantoicase [Thermoanaerobaculia bacterium]|nr:allantoicase [Thermoanaerobaculia bacterium]
MNFRDLLDLASERLGGSVIDANDDFFAEKENLIKPYPPVWKEHEYTDRGKWMDGWESRRKRVPGYDFAVIRLGCRGVVRGVVVDTAFFRGNYPESCSIDGSAGGETWIELLPRAPLQGDTQNEFIVLPQPVAVTHVRLNIFPDGGVARLRVHGHVIPEWRLVGGLGNEVDLAAAENGGDVLACSDMFFGPKHNLIMPGRAHNMSDGWETRRRRGPGHDWVIVMLATIGRVRRIEIDTNHFKGNYPDTASIEGSVDGEQWTEVLPRTKMQAHTRHFFIDELLADGPFTQLRLNVYPDGGVSRLRVWGRATERGLRGSVVQRVNTLLDTRELRNCCGSQRWAEQVAAARPFESWDALLETANRAWYALDARDWLEAFSAHPRIGERKAGWSSQEQSGTQTASEDTMRALADAQRAYEEKFGFIYLVCATGRTADELLANVRERMQNDRDAELRIAADEQAKITALRLEKLVL